MKLIQFPEQTTVYAQNQPQYLPLPAHVFPDDEHGAMAFCWKLGWKERLLLMLTGKLWHEVWTFNHPLQPQRISLQKPKMKSRFHYLGWTCGKLMITRTMQAQGAPLVDRCTTSDWQENRYKGYAILLRPWKRNEYGDREIQPALVIGWRQTKPKDQNDEPPQ